MQEGATKSWKIDDEDPVTIAHVILWSYAGDYGDIANAGLPSDPDLIVEDILQGGKSSNGSDSTFFVAQAMEDEDLYPKTMHAQVYKFARKYGITALKEKAVADMTVLLEELDDDSEFLVPLMAEFFGLTKNGVDLSTGSKASSQAPPTPTSPDPTTHNDLRSPLGPPTRLTPVASLTDDDATAALITKDKDQPLWDLLADEAAKNLELYEHDSLYDKCMLQHPFFNLDVAKRMREHSRVKMEKMQAKIKALEASQKKGKGAGVQGKETKPRQSKKRAAKAMSQDTESIKGDAAS
jgi:hypothetical protein